jgi:hypothetical protein
MAHRLRITLGKGDNNAIIHNTVAHFLECSREAELLE